MRIINLTSTTINIVRLITVNVSQCLYRPNTATIETLVNTESTQLYYIRVASVSLNYFYSVGNR